MAANHKLTSLIKGRFIRAMDNEDGSATISFADGSTMKIRTAVPTNTTFAGQTVVAVRQNGTELDFDSENGATLTIQTVEATSCVTLRDATGTLEYAD